MPDRDRIDRPTTLPHGETGEGRRVRVEDRSRGVDPRRIRAASAGGAVDDPADPRPWRVAEADAQERRLPDDADEPVERPHRVRRRPRPARPLPRPRVPGFVARADVAADPVALSLIGVGVLSALVMAVVTGSRVGALPEIFVLRVGTEGEPVVWGEPRALWRLPLLAMMVLVMNVVAAWAVSPADRFASRFLIGAAVGVQLIAWVAAIHFFW